MGARGDDWVSALALPAHREILRRFVAGAEAEPRFRFIELSCSVARGAGDKLSDLDLALGIADDAWPDALGAVAPLLARLGDVVELLDHKLAEWGDIPHRRFFVQYRDLVQVDLVALPAGRRPGMPAGSVALYDPDGRLATTVTSSLMEASAADVREWAFLAWIALADLDKYLRRGSAWEALERLHTARTHVWRLWAVTHGVGYPAFGLTSVLDQPEAGCPDRIDETAASLHPADLRRAATVLASVLADVSSAAARRSGAQLPDAMSTFVRARLAEAGPRL